MTSKKEKYIRILNRISREKDQKNKKMLSEYAISFSNTSQNSSLFDYLVFKAILEQAEGLSLTFTKPHSYTAEGAEKTRLSKEAYETLEKSAALRPTRLGPLTLIG